MSQSRTEIARQDTTPIEAAHARGLREGRTQGRARFWWLLNRKNIIGVRYRNVVGRKRRLENAGDRLALAVREFAPWVDENESETLNAEVLREAYRSWFDVRIGEK